MPDNDSLKDFLRDVIEDHDAGASSVESRTLPSSQSKQGLGTLPGHEVESLIARGGMGAVYLARQHALEREVAVKVMTADADSPEMAARFRREALVLGKLAHPNIVPIYDIGTDDDGQLFYTMKLVKGRTLQHILNDLREQNAETVRTHTLASLLTVFRKVCDAMAFAHSQGVIHRDLKPENVMVGEFGEVLVMDWGLAKMTAERSETASQGLPRRGECSEANDECGMTNEETGAHASDHSSFTAPASANSLHTLQGAVLGTPQYMSPEQARGEIDALDERSDIFSLGGILYAILTLRPPVEGTTLDEVLKKVTSAQITSPSALQTGTAANERATKKGEVLKAKLIKPLPHIAGGRVPAALSAVVMKALRLDKAQRYPSVVELSADIEAYQGGFATKAEHAGLARQLILLMMRHKAVAASLAVLIVVSIGFVLKVMASERKATRNAEVATENEKAARRALTKSALSLAEARLREKNGPGMKDALAEVPEDLRDTTWHYLHDEADTSVAALQTSTTNLFDAAPDPTRAAVFAVADRNRIVTLINVQTGERLLEFIPQFTKEDAASGYRVAFSPDGQFIAVGRNGPGGIVIHRASDGAAVRAWETPTSEYLAYGGDRRLLRRGGSLAGDFLQVWDPVTGTLLWQRESKGSTRIHGVFLPGNQEVAQFSQENGLQIVAADDGRVLRSLKTRSNGYAFRMAARPDGEAIFMWHDDRITYCVSLEDGRTLFKLPGVRGMPRFGFTGDGSQFVIADWNVEDGTQSIDVFEAQTGDAVRSLLGGAGVIDGLGIHPVSNQLVVTGQKSRFWEVTGVPPRWTWRAGGADNVTFWGSDDLVFRRAGEGAPWGLQPLDSPGAGMLWTAPAFETNAAFLSRDGRTAAVVHPGYSNAIQLLRGPPPAVEEIATLDAGFWPYRVRLSPGSTRVIAIERAYIPPFKFALLDAATGSAGASPDLSGVIQIRDMGWIDDGRYLGLLTKNDYRGNPRSEEWIVLWDAATGKELRAVRNPTGMDALAIAPDGRLFAEAGKDKMVRIRDAETLDVVKEFRAHDAAITSLAWHPKKPVIASGSEDFSVKLWNIETGRCVEKRHGFSTAPYFMDFSPGGTRLGVTFPERAIARIWEPESLK